MIKSLFDLWEENKGWHFYTRMVQLKFLKNCLKLNKYLKLDGINICKSRESCK